MRLIERQGLFSLFKNLFYRFFNKSWAFLLNQLDDDPIVLTYCILDRLFCCCCGVEHLPVCGMVGFGWRVV